MSVPQHYYFGPGCQIQLNQDYTETPRFPIPAGTTGLVNRTFPSQSGADVSIKLTTPLYAQDDTEQRYPVSEITLPIEFLTLTQPNRSHPNYDGSYKYLLTTQEALRQGYTDGYGVAVVREWPDNRYVIVEVLAQHSNYLYMRLRSGLQAFHAPVDRPDDANMLAEVEFFAADDKRKVGVA